MSFLHELVGFKLGLAVDEQQLRKGYEQASTDAPWPEDRGAVYRLRSEVVQSLAGAILHHFGDPDARRDGIPPAFAFLKEHGLSENAAIAQDVVALLGAAVEATEPGGEVGVDDLLAEAEERHGAIGVQLALGLLQSVTASQRVDPWSQTRRREWHDELGLVDLFYSDRATATYGSFFDQRFIDFLYNAVDDLDRIHWRKFEALVAEWFARHGLHVVLGPGRADGGVDLRAWSRQEDTKGPPLLIVQCKRQRAKVEQVVVKALFADVVHEGAQWGLVATTSAVSASGERVAKAREYPIKMVNRPAIRQWLERMRTPGAGLWLPI